MSEPILYRVPTRLVFDGAVDVYADSPWRAKKIVEDTLAFRLEIFRDKPTPEIDNYDLDMIPWELSTGRPRKLEEEK